MKPPPDTKLTCPTCGTFIGVASGFHMPDVPESECCKTAYYAECDRRGILHSRCKLRPVGELVAGPRHADEPRVRIIAWCKQLGVDPSEAFGENRKKTHEAIAARREIIWHMRQLGIKRHRVCEVLEMSDTSVDRHIKTMKKKIESGYVPKLETQAATAV